jgi:broad specificity phosphatase PhoE
MKITYFVHSITKDNERGVASGWLEAELSEEGIKRIKQLPQLVNDTSFEVIFPSDLKRAIDSATIPFGTTHKIIPDKRLREANYGDLDGTPKSFKKHIKDYINQPYPRGESYADVEKRMRDFLEEKRAEDWKHIAIIGHEATQLALEVICNGKTWEQAIDNDWRPTQSWQPGWVYIYNS